MPFPSSESLESRTLMSSTGTGTVLNTAVAADQLQIKIDLLKFRSDALGCWATLLGDGAAVKAADPSKATTLAPLVSKFRTDIKQMHLSLKVDRLTQDSATLADLASIVGVRKQLLADRGNPAAQAADQGADSSRSHQASERPHRRPQRAARHPASRLRPDLQRRPSDRDRRPERSQCQSRAASRRRKVCHRPHYLYDHHADGFDEADRRPSPTRQRPDGKSVGDMISTAFPAVILLFHASVDASVSASSPRAQAMAGGSFAGRPFRDTARWRASGPRGGLARSTRPFSRTRMRSAPAIVLRRWAITKLVRPDISVCRLDWIRRSDSVSRLLVASSRIRMRGSASRARAMVRRWRCPPESLTPRSPMKVS